MTDRVPWIEFGNGWAKIHYCRETTEEDRAALTAAFHGVAQEPAPATWLDHVRAGLQAIVDLKNPMPRAAVREAVAELLASLPPARPHRTHRTQKENRS